MSDYTGYNMPPGVSNVDIPGFLCDEEEDECCEICGDVLDDGACENCGEEEEEDEDA